MNTNFKVVDNTFFTIINNKIEKIEYDKPIFFIDRENYIFLNDDYILVDNHLVFQTELEAKIVYKKHLEELIENNTKILNELKLENLDVDSFNVKDLDIEPNKSYNNNYKKGKLEIFKVIDNKVYLVVSNEILTIQFNEEIFYKTIENWGEFQNIPIELIPDYTFQTKKDAIDYINRSGKLANNN